MFDEMFLYLCHLQMGVSCAPGDSETNVVKLPTLPM